VPFAVKRRTRRPGRPGARPRKAVGVCDVT
jgi:hypothetical protein